MYAAQNYLYIVFAVIYIIYSIIKAGKKVVKNRPGSSANPASMPIQGDTSQKKEEFKPVQPPVASPFPGHTGSLKKMMGELLGETPETKIPEARVPGPASQTFPEKPGAHRPQPAPHPAATVKHTPHTSPMTNAPFTHHKQPPDNTKTSAKKIVEEPEAKEELEPNFDIRQAIIYSEILKRPSW